MLRTMQCVAACIRPTYHIRRSPMRLVKIACGLGVLALLGACAAQQPDYLRVSSPCAPNLVSVAVLF